MSVNSSIFTNLQSINPSAIIELFTLQLSSSLHGATTIYRFHAGSNLNANGKIVWAGNEYLRFPVQAERFAYQQDLHYESVMQLVLCQRFFYL